MALNEAQRQAYLEVMGIKSYFPRFVLPGARPSVKCDWPENILAVDSPESETRLAITESKSVAIQTNNATIKSKPEQATVPQLSEPTAEKISQTEALEEIRFQLAFIRINENICVLNQLPYVGGKHLGLSHQKLLLNIVKSLDLDHENLHFNELPFRWPFGEFEHLKKNEGAARQALHAYLDQRMLEQGFNTLLLMGEMAVRFLQPRDHSNDVKRGVLTIVDGLPWKTASLESLDEMLKMPALKRDVWVDLRSLLLTPAI